MNRYRNLLFFNVDQHDFMSKHLRYGRPYEESAFFSMKNILKDHIARSWPEELLQLVKKGYVKKSLDWIKTYSGRHCHEPMIARVLQEAAKCNEIDIVQQLLDDGVHPDVCVKRGEDPAFEVVGRSKDIGSSESTRRSKSTEGLENPEDSDGGKRSEIRKLLYERGAKVHTSPSSLPWKYWHCIGKLNPSESLKEMLRKLNEPEMNKLTTNSMGDEEFRGLIVEIYSRIPKREDSATQQQESTKDSTNDGMANLGKQTQDGNCKGDRAADHEFHRIAYPTVEELIYDKGPEAIMGRLGSELLGPDYQRFRWIHIPMNHVSEFVRIPSLMANSECL